MHTRIEFRGWSRRVVNPHVHRVEAIEPVVVRSPLGDVHTDRIQATGEEGPTFESAWSASWLISDLALSGNFLVTFKLDKEMLHDWLAAYVAESPGEARQFLQEMVQQANRSADTQ